MITKQLNLLVKEWRKNAENLHKSAIETEQPITKAILHDRAESLEDCAIQLETTIAATQEQQDRINNKKQEAKLASKSKTDKIRDFLQDSEKASDYIVEPTLTNAAKAAEATLKEIGRRWRDEEQSNGSTGVA